MKDLHPNTYYKLCLLGVSIMITLLFFCITSCNSSKISSNEKIIQIESITFEYKEFTLVSKSDYKIYIVVPEEHYDFDAPIRNWLQDYIENNNLPYELYLTINKEGYYKSITITGVPMYNTFLYGVMDTIEKYTNCEMMFEPGVNLNPKCNK